MAERTTTENVLRSNSAATDSWKDTAGQSAQSAPRVSYDEEAFHRRSAELDEASANGSEGTGEWNRDDGSDPDFDPPPPPVRPRSSRAPSSSARGQPAAPTDGQPPATSAQFRDQPVRRKKFGGLVWELENKGAVARDHLALERTFLAWLRTSLALASIGIAVTQLFRLPTGTSTTTTSFSSAVRSNLVEATSPPNVLLSSLGSLSTSYPVLADLLAPVLGAQQAQLAELGTTVSRYSHLAKPIGGTFIALALLFLLLGTYRFFHVQHAFVSEPSIFPPSRKTYALGAFCIGALIVATFAATIAANAR